MRTYTILYCNYNKQILILILFPLLLITPLVIVLASINNLSEVVLYISVFAWMAVMILITNYMVFKQVYTTISLTITAKGLDISPVKRTLFNRFKFMHIPFNNIKRITDDEDVNYNNRKFFILRLKQPSKKIMLMAQKNALPREMERFQAELADAIHTYNEWNVGVQDKIKEGSFYTSTFAKVFTVCLIAGIIIVTIIQIADPKSGNWFKLIWFYSISVAWFANYNVARNKAKKKGGL